MSHAPDGASFGSCENLHESPYLQDRSLNQPQQGALRAAGEEDLGLDFGNLARSSSVAGR